MTMDHHPVQDSLVKEIMFQFKCHLGEAFWDNKTYRTPCNHIFIVDEQFWPNVFNEPGKRFAL